MANKKVRSKRPPKDKKVKGVPKKAPKKAVSLKSPPPIDTTWERELETAVSKNWSRMCNNELPDILLEEDDGTPMAREWI